MKAFTATGAPPCVNAGTATNATANPTTAKTLRLRIVLPSFCEDLVVYVL
jgi:hypothetical protein